MTSLDIEVYTPEQPSKSWSGTELNCYRDQGIENYWFIINAQTQSCRVAQWMNKVVTHTCNVCTRRTADFDSHLKYHYIKYTVPITRPLYELRREKGPVCYNHLMVPWPLYEDFIYCLTTIPLYDHGPGPVKRGLYYNLFHGPTTRTRLRNSTIVSGCLDQDEDLISV